MILSYDHFLHGIIWDYGDKLIIVIDYQLFSMKENDILKQIANKKKKIECVANCNNLQQISIQKDDTMVS
jgi:hypothetical protein